MSKVWRSYPVSVIAGEIKVPGDKSISHRAIMFGALADGTTEISGFLEGEDCLATMKAFQKMGVPITHHGQGRVTVQGQGVGGLQAPETVLDVGNSGTSMRLMAGLLAGQQFDSELVGDHSLMKRPMRRVTRPLALMGANISTTEQGTAPLKIKGSELTAIAYQMPVASAQLKSCLLLAGLYAKGRTEIEECGVSRDHSERMLHQFGVKLEKTAGKICIEGGQRLQATQINVPSDISSAAFFIVAGLIAQEGEVLIKSVGMNPTRSAVVNILQEMGGDITILNHNNEESGEPIADLFVRPSQLKGIKIPEKYVPIAIDEFPIIFIAASCASGKTQSTQLHELRVKESDRLAAMEEGLKALGIECHTTEDSIEIVGGKLTGGAVESYGDHRIAMSFAVAATVAADVVEINDCDNVATSFPIFTDLAQQLGMKIETR